MDNMEQTLSLKVAGKWVMCGTISVVSALTSSEFEGVMKALILLVGFATAVFGMFSIGFTMLANKRKARIRSINEAVTHRQLCDSCRAGHPPVICPFEGESAFPPDCPHADKMLKRKVKSRFFKWFTERQTEEESTT
jgi:hypothetical protein